MKKGLSFSFLDLRFQDEIVQLRHSEYRRCYGNHVDLSGLNWNNADKNSIHLGIRDLKDDLLIAYLRLSGFRSNSKLENTTLFTTPENINLPVALLTRAANRKNYESFGLHSILRCRALEVCLKNNVKTVLGTLEISANRFEPLKKLGYSILSTKNDWGNQSYIRSGKGVALIGLESSEKIKEAVSKLQKKYELQPLDKVTLPMLQYI